MKNQERWDFSQRKSSHELIKLGVILFLLSFIPFLIELNESQKLIIGLLLLILCTIFLFIRVENAIKKKFDK